MIHLSILLLWVLELCAVSCQRHGRSPNKSGNYSTKYHVYTAYGRSKKQNTNLDGERFDNCGLWVYMVEPKYQGIFLRADAKSLRWVEVQRAPQYEGKTYVGSIESSKWDAAKDMALNMTLHKPPLHYGWSWCVRQSTSLRWRWRQKGYLRLSSAAKTAAIVGSGLGAVAAGLIGVSAREALRPKSREEHEIELQDMAGRRLHNVLQNGLGGMFKQNSWEIPTHVKTKESQDSSLHTSHTSFQSNQKSSLLDSSHSSFGQDAHKEPEHSTKVTFHLPAPGEGSSRQHQEQQSEQVHQHASQPPAQEPPQAPHQPPQQRPLQKAWQRISNRPFRQQYERVPGPPLEESHEQPHEQHPSQQLPQRPPPQATQQQPQKPPKSYPLEESPKSSARPPGDAHEHTPLQGDQRPPPNPDAKPPPQHSDDGNGGTPLLQGHAPSKRSLPALARRDVQATPLSNLDYATSKSLQERSAMTSSSAYHVKTIIAQPSSRPLPSGNPYRQCGIWIGPTPSAPRGIFLRADPASGRFEWEDRIPFPAGGGDVGYLKAHSLQTAIGLARAHLIGQPHTRNGAHALRWCREAVDGLIGTWTEQQVLTPEISRSAEEPPVRTEEGPRGSQGGFREVRARSLKGAPVELDGLDIRALGLQKREMETPSTPSSIALVGEHGPWRLPTGKGTALPFCGVLIRRPKGANVFLRADDFTRSYLKIRSGMHLLPGQPAGVAIRPGREPTAVQRSLRLGLPERKVADGESYEAWCKRANKRLLKSWFLENLLAWDKGAEKEKPEGHARSPAALARKELAEEQLRRPTTSESKTLLEISKMHEQAVV